MGIKQKVMGKEQELLSAVLTHNQPKHEFLGIAKEWLGIAKKQLSTANHLHGIASSIQYLPETINSNRCTLNNLRLTIAVMQQVTNVYFVIASTLRPQGETISMKDFECKRERWI